jgi:hypothetical protein
MTKAAWRALLSDPPRPPGDPAEPDPDPDAPPPIEEPPPPIHVPPDPGPPPLHATAARGLHAALFTSRARR